MSTLHLAKMANQIAASVPDQQDAARQTAAHLTAFWTPAMIDDLARAAADDESILTPPARAAVARLR